MSAKPRMNQYEPSSSDSYDAYLQVRTALFHFGRFPSELENDSERNKLADEVLKQGAINRSVQSSPEYSQMLVPEQELEQALKEIYEQIPEETDLDALLLGNGLSHSSLREAIELDLRVAAVLNYIAEQQPEVNEMDAEIFYQLHTDRFVIPEQRTARHILVTINDDYAENSREAALARIKKAQKELLKKPFKFEKLARSTSECPTAMEGGLLGTVSAGQLYPEVDAALFEMKEGAISDVIESPLGFHVLKCEAIMPQSKPEFEEVREKVKNALRKRNQRVAQRQWLQQRMKASSSN